MTRGTIVVVAAKGTYTGKPRPALVVQSDLFNEIHPSVTICLITSECVDAPMFRITLSPGKRTGLSRVSQAMVDKIVSVPRASITAEIGHCEESVLGIIDEALRRWLSLD